jgi:hypothetical protein
MRQMSEKKYDFTKIHLTNGLTPGYDKGSNRRPFVTAVLVVVALGIGWAVVG